MSLRSVFCFTRFLSLSLARWCLIIHSVGEFLFHQDTNAVYHLELKWTTKTRRKRVFLLFLLLPPHIGTHINQHAFLLTLVVRKIKLEAENSHFYDWEKKQTNIKQHHHLGVHSWANNTEQSSRFFAFVVDQTNKSLTLHLCRSIEKARLMRSDNPPRMVSSNQIVFVAAIDCITEKLCVSSSKVIRLSSNTNHQRFSISCLILFRLRSFSLRLTQIRKKALSRLTDERVSPRRNM